MVGAVVGTRKEDKKVSLEHLVMQFVEVVVMKSVTRDVSGVSKNIYFFVQIITS